MLSPPRERPSPSRPGRAAGFLSFAAAPRDQVRGQGPARAGGMLVRADHRGIGAERPVLALGLIAADPQPVQDLLPGPVTRPAAMPVIDSLPVPEPLRQVTLRATGPGPEEDPVDHHPVVGPPAAPQRIGGQEHPQPLPFLIRQIVAIQSIEHRTDLHQPGIKIHGTRPSGVSPQPGEPCPHAELSENGSGRIDAVARCAPGMDRLLAVGGLAACPTGACHDATAHCRRCPGRAREF